MSIQLEPATAALMADQHAAMAALAEQHAASHPATVVPQAPVAAPPPATDPIIAAAKSILAQWGTGRPAHACTDKTDATKCHVCSAWEALREAAK